MRQLIVIGVPISGTLLLEWGLFSSAALLVGWIGTTALAAHQIALQIAAILFMVPFGISMAATVRVGHAVGRGDAGRDAARGLHRDRRSAPSSWSAMTLLVVALAQRHSAAVPRRRSRGVARDGALAGALLLLGATFFIADGIQGIAAGALRGLNDTRVPLLLRRAQLLAGRIHQRLRCSASRWGLGVFGIWIGFSLGVCGCSALLADGAFPQSHAHVAICRLHRSLDAARRSPAKRRP